MFRTDPPRPRTRHVVILYAMCFGVGFGLYDCAGRAEEWRDCGEEAAIAEWATLDHYDGGTEGAALSGLLSSGPVTPEQRHILREIYAAPPDHSVTPSTAAIDAHDSYRLRCEIAERGHPR